MKRLADILYKLIMGYGYKGNIETTLRVENLVKTCEVYLGDLKIILIQNKDCQTFRVGLIEQFSPWMTTSILYDSTNDKNRLQEIADFINNHLNLEDYTMKTKLKDLYKAITGETLEESYPCESLHVFRYIYKQMIRFSNITIYCHGLESYIEVESISIYNKGEHRHLTLFDRNSDINKIKVIEEILNREVTSKINK